MAVSTAATKTSDTNSSSGSVPLAKHPFRIRRVPGIDGLRGLAVATVVIYHFFDNVLPGGYIGVDIFFVLSGFLITSLLIRERAVTGRIDLKDFWLRRLRRIAPAAMFVMFISIAVAGLIGGDPAVGLSTQFLGTVFFVNNWTQIAGSQSYFADSGVQLLAHYWSLSVEEQFYLFWPLIFVALLTLKLAFRKLAAVAAVGSVVSFVWMVALYDPKVDPTRVYYGTDTHAFGLLFGAALALWLTSTSSRAEADSWTRTEPLMRDFFGSSAQAFVVASLPLIFLSVVLLTMSDTASVTYRGGLVFASLLSVAILYLVVRGVSPVRQIFEFKPLCWLGKISFSLYLWHWPVIVLIRELLERNEAMQYEKFAAVAGVALSLVLANWSFKNVETPIRRLGYRGWLAQFSGTQFAGSWKPGVAAGVALVVVVGAVVGMATGPKMTRLEAQLQEATERRAKAQKAEEAELAKRVMPRGDQITAIGDSVMLASASALEDKLPGIYIDAAVSRGYPAAPGIIASMEAAGTLDQFVVLGLGINQSAAASDEHLLDEILDSLSDNRIIVLINPYGDRVWMPQSEKEVLNAAKKRDNVYVADWCHGVRDDQSKLRADLIHPTPDGANVYADAVVDAFQQYAKNKKRIPDTCGI
ncbi:acyltransferase family protein [uncultured Corynebacterium sp.]|uniref:acyltransferase family protein n=1 Tax=uncultured Corynebacterium sp. TaxID=159447 RepID=UPI00262C40C1|nr:acyltransferase family protein [uncultured Corynebacterium sp.]